MITTRAREKKTAKTQKPEERNWYLVDVNNKVLGRIATRVAILLMGKNKPTWQPNLDTGDNVIITNAAKISVTGRKEGQKNFLFTQGKIILTKPRSRRNWSYSLCLEKKKQLKKQKPKKQKKEKQK